MEQARFWMLTKRKHSTSLSSHLPQPSTRPSHDDSWEEQAFAEDAAGRLGGCVWPPRSYSCSFCRREFRSAQALGGHMNVHRRDRARLKQSPGPHNNEILQDDDDHPNHQNLFQYPYTSLGFQYPTQICSLVYSPNPNSDPAVLASPSSPSNKVSTTPSQGNFDALKNLVFSGLPSSTTKQERCKSLLRSSGPSLANNAAADRFHHISDPCRTDGEKNPRIVESGCRAEVDYVKNDLSVSLNLDSGRTFLTIADDDEREEAIACKRRRTSTSPLLPLFMKSKSVDTHHVQAEVFEINPCSREELDLELRLGDRPKVK